MTEFGKRAVDARLFGTDGVRGVANIEPMNVETAVRLGRSAAHVFRGGTHRPRILIGKDTRLSGYMLESALVAGICSMGVDAILVGPLPTPGIAFATRTLRADAGIVISASHNPYMDNGIKFFNRDGFKLPDRLEREIEELTFTGRIDDVRPTADSVGKAFRIDDVAGRYLEFLKGTLPRGFTLDGLRVVVDAAHGAAYRVGPDVMAELGAEVIALGTAPSGTNINDGVGSMHAEAAAARVREGEADVGICLDGDADRCVLVDSDGNLVDGDHVLAICARAWKHKGELRHDTVVATVMSNLGLDLAMREIDVTVERTDVGDRHVVAQMREGGYCIGGEQSGHTVFLDFNSTADGLITALQVLRVMRDTDQSLGELAASMQRLPQVLKNVDVAERRPFEELSAVLSAIRDAESSLGDRGRVLVRYSGTQLMARVMVEGEDAGQIASLASDIVSALEASA
ncbi:MAG TPA: phosphoglucosamine mutase [Acidobacteriota bacterium]|nr:phosphoglucosamine mutase [Acidobacteriota bacterium]